MLTVASQHSTATRLFFPDTSSPSYPYPLARMPFTMDARNHFHLDGFTELNVRRQVIDALEDPKCNSETIALLLENVFCRGIQENLNQLIKNGEIKIATLFGNVRNLLAERYIALIQHEDGTLKMIESMVRQPITRYVHECNIFPTGVDKIIADYAQETVVTLSYLAEILQIAEKGNFSAALEPLLKEVSNQGKINLFNVAFAAHINNRAYSQLLQAVESGIGKLPSLVLCSGINLCEFKLTGIRLNSVNLVDARFAGADLTHAVFQNCEFRAIIFGNVDFTNAQFIDCRFFDTKFDVETNLNTAKFKGSTFLNCQIASSYLVQTAFESVEFMNTPFEVSANFYKVKFHKAVFNSSPINTKAGLDSSTFKSITADSVSKATLPWSVRLICGAAKDKPHAGSKR